MTTYYVSSTGNDSNDGLSPSQAWLTIAKVNQFMENTLPGDFILFEGGSTFISETESIFVFDNREYNVPPILGDDSDPLTIGSYGTGKAVLRFGTDIDGFYVFTANLVVRDLIITSLDLTNSNTSAGINFRTQGTTSNTQYTKTKILNTEIYNFKYGIQNIDYSTSISYYKTIEVDNCYIHDCLEAAVLLRSQTTRKFDNVKVTNCYTERIFGYVRDPGDEGHDGSHIVLGQCQNSLIENCEANGTVSPNANGHNGIWFWRSDNCTIRNCIAYGFNGSSAGDCGGFGSDLDCNNVIIEHNFAYNCQGQGILLMSGSNNIARFNIIFNCCNSVIASQAGAIYFYGAGGASLIPTGSCKIYNNTIINLNTQNNCSGIACEKSIDTCEIYNNIIYTTKTNAPAIQLPNFTSGSATIYGNLYYNAATKNAQNKSNNITYSGLAAWKALGYEAIISSLETDPGFLNLTTTNPLATNFIPQNISLIFAEVFNLVNYSGQKDYLSRSFIKPPLGAFALTPDSYRHSKFNIRFPTLKRKSFNFNTYISKLPNKSLDFSKASNSKYLGTEIT